MSWASIAELGGEKDERKRVKVGSKDSLGSKAWSYFRSLSLSDVFSFCSHWHFLSFFWLLRSVCLPERTHWSAKRKCGRSEDDAREVKIVEGERSVRVFSWRGRETAFCAILTLTLLVVSPIVTSFRFLCPLLHLFIPSLFFCIIWRQFPRFRRFVSFSRHKRATIVSLCR